MKAVVYVAWNIDGIPIYVGQTGNLRKRMNVHRATSPWFAEMASVTTTDEMELSEALAFEARLVPLLAPRYNKSLDGQGTMPERPAPPCGTIPAVRRHYRRKEPIDDTCRLTWNEYCREKAAQARRRRAAS